MSAMPASSAFQRIEYPERDGKPMGETDAHRREIMAIIEMLSLFFRDDPTVYVTGNLMLYYEEGNPGAVTSPDVFVVKASHKGLRRTYKLWEERTPPCVVFEISSRSTRLEDQGTKRVLYAMLGVREYFLFDPLAEYLRPPLQGFRLADDEYVAIAADDDGALLSQELGLRMLRAGSALRLIDTATDQPLPRLEDLDDARHAAEQQARAEADARRAAEQQLREAEDELARLRAELARLRAEH